MKILGNLFKFLLAESGSVNLNNLWFVIPSALLAICTIAGLLIFYGRKIKAKIDKNKKTKTKNLSYSRNNKQNSKKQKVSKLERLENDYKNKKIDVEKYLKKREKLEKD